MVRVRNQPDFIMTSKIQKCNEHMYVFNKADRTSVIAKFRLPFKHQLKTKPPPIPDFMLLEKAKVTDRFKTAMLQSLSRPVP